MLGVDKLLYLLIASVNFHLEKGIIQPDEKIEFPLEVED